MAGYIGSKVNVSQIDGYVKSEVDTLLGQELNLSGGSMTGHLNFGDNIKSQYGAGTDLQIYHDASNSYIKDAGTGSLRLSATAIELMKVDTSELMASFAQDGAVTLYYDNAVKLATTSTGIDVTGTVTATTLQTTAGGTVTTASGNDLNIVYPDTRSLFFKEGSTTTLTLDNAQNATFAGSVTATGQIISAGGALSAPTYSFTGDTNTGISRPTSSAVNIVTAGQERMRIDSSGNVGINVTPTQKLHVGGNAIITGITRIGNGTESSPAYQFVDDTNTGMYRSSSDVLGFSTGGGNRLTLNSTGASFAGTVTATGMTATGANTNAATYATFQRSDGAVSTRIRYDGSTTTLFGTSTNHPLAFETNATERMRIDSSGTLILKSANKLQLNRSDNARSMKIFNDNSFGTIQTTNDPILLDGQSYIRFDIASDEKMRIDSSGTVAVGTTVSPTWTTFDGRIRVGARGVVATTTASTQLIHNAYYDGAYKRIGGTDFASRYYQNDGAHVWDTAVSGAANSTISFVESMRIDGSGKLLVGKTSSNYATEGVEIRSNEVLITKAGENPLSVRNNGNGGLISFNSAGTSVGSIGTDGGSLVIGGGDVGLGFYQSADALVPYNGITGLRDSAINLGMASSGRFKDLHLSGAVKVGGDIEAIGTNSKIMLGESTAGGLFGHMGWDDASNSLYLGHSYGSAFNKDIVINGSGNVGIGIVGQAGVKLYVDAPSSFHAAVFRNVSAGYAPIISDNIASSGTRYLVSLRVNNVEKGKITSDGSTVTYATSSDYRLKENVSDMTGATARLKQLKPKRFDWIGNAEAGTQDGFLAHEVSSIVPEAITGTKDAVDADGNPEYQGIDQSKLVPLLIKTIQELEARLTAGGL